MNKFYVYVYVDPFKIYNKSHLNIHFKYEPFYIGKGTGNRYKIHLNKAKRVISTSNHKINRIKSILHKGKEPIIIKIKENLDNKEACLLEIELIKSIGRRDLNTGTLCNLYDSQGVNLNEELEQIRQNKTKGIKNGMYGRTHSEETKKYISKLKKELVGEKSPRFGKCSKLKGKTYEEILGTEKSKELRLRKSNFWKAKCFRNKSYKHSLKTKNKIAISKKGNKNPAAKPLLVTFINGLEKRFDTIKQLLFYIPNLTRYEVNKIIEGKYSKFNLRIEKIWVNSLQE